MVARPRLWLPAQQPVATGRSWSAGERTVQDLLVALER
jgi:hypothetical protein